MLKKKKQYNAPVGDVKKRKKNYGRPLKKLSNLDTTDVDDFCCEKTHMCNDQLFNRLTNRLYNFFFHIKLFFFLLLNFLIYCFSFI